MSQVVQALPTANTVSVPSWLDHRQRALLQNMLEDFRTFRYSRGDRQPSVEDAIAVILDFVTHGRGIPGELQPADFEKWSCDLRTKKSVRKSTQRKYQSTIRTFFDYLLDTPKFRNLLRNQLDLELVQVATPENCIIHRDQHQDAGEGRSFTEEEEEKFFHAIDREIEFAHAAGCTSQVHILQRDKAMFCVQRGYGLRETETLGLALNSFEHDPKAEQFGNYGICRVLGKGGKWRAVPCSDYQVADVLDWYLKEIRKEFACKAHSQQRALWLSTRGNPLSYSGYYQRFQKVINAAFLPDDLVPHGLRHTSITTDALDGANLQAISKKHGHVYSSTTQGYTHVPEDFVVHEFSRIAQVRAAGRK